jgi:hypothetical protein
MQAAADSLKADRYQWLAAHREAGIWAGIFGLPLAFPLPMLLAGADAPFLVLLAAVPGWLVQRRCARTMLAITGPGAASGIWLLLDASSWCWLLRAVMLFRIRNSLWYQQPTWSKELQITASHLAVGMLICLVLGAGLGLLQACSARPGSWRLRWGVASSLALASGFGLLFGVPQLVLQLISLTHLSLPHPLFYGLLAGVLCFSSWMYWQVRGWITLRVVTRLSPA